MTKRIQEMLRENGWNDVMVKTMLLESIIEAVGEKKVVDNLNEKSGVEFEIYDLVYLIDYILNE